MSGFGLGKQSNEIRGFVAPTAAGFESQDDQPATSGLEKFRVSAFLTPAGCMESCPGVGACTAATLPVPCQRGDKGGVDGQLSSAPKVEAIGNDFDASVILTGDLCQVEVCHPGVGCDPCPCFSADPGCSPLECHPSTAKNPCLWASGTVVAK